MSVHDQKMSLKEQFFQNIHATLFHTVRADVGCTAQVFMLISPNFIFSLPLLPSNAHNLIHRNMNNYSFLILKLDLL